MRLFGLMIGHYVSNGTIRNITNATSVKAEDFNKTISLSGINTVAIDEILQHNTTVLTDADLDTRFVVMMEPVIDRTSCPRNPRLKH